MAASSFAATKRTHEDFKASTSDQLPASASSKERTIPCTSVTREEPQRKRAKVAHDPSESAEVCMEDSHEPTDQRVMSLEEVAKREEMEIKGGETSVEVATTPTVSLQRADDIANNPYAPPTSDAEAHAVYLKEVGTRYINLRHTPTQASDSSMPFVFRELIENRLFKGWSNAQCQVPYNEHGGGAGSIQAVSIRYHDRLPKWFKEENAVLPWGARGSADRKRLMKAGLSHVNFPLLYPTQHAWTDAPPPAPTPKKSRSQKNKAAPSASKSPAASAAQQGLRATVEDYLDLNAGEIAPAATPTRDLVRAALNAPALATKGDHIITNDETGQSLLSIHNPALSQICEAVQDDTYLDDFSLPIVRAFVNAISPAPAATLPQHDIDFVEFGVNMVNVLGIMDPVVSPPVIKKIDWTVEKLVELHRLSKKLGCTVIQDLIVDEMHRLFATHYESGDCSSLDIPIEYMSSLDDETDRPLLRLMVDILIVQQGQSKCVSADLSAHVQNMVSDREAGDYSVVFSNPSDASTAFCKAYHLHDGDSACQKTCDTAEKDNIKLLYQRVKQVATKQTDHRLAICQQRLDTLAESQDHAASVSDYPEEARIRVHQRHEQERKTLIPTAIQKEYQAALTLARIQELEVMLQRHPENNMEMVDDARRELRSLNEKMDLICAEHLKAWESFVDRYALEKAEVEKKFGRSRR